MHSRDFRKCCSCCHAVLASGLCPSQSLSFVQEQNSTEHRQAKGCSLSQPVTQPQHNIALKPGMITTSAGRLAKLPGLDLYKLLHDLRVCNDCQTLAATVPRSPMQYLNRCRSSPPTSNSLLGVLLSTPSFRLLDQIRCDILQA